jgi:hypothetical protein
MNRSALTLPLALLVCSAADGMAQRRPTAPGEPGKPLTLSARIDGKAYTATGPGSCRHTPEASIYDLPAALWMIEYGNPGGGAIQQVNLTLWKPKDGSSDQISLALEAGSSSYRIASGGKAPSGSATLKLSPSGAGGRFELKGKDAKGTNIELTVNCPAFAGVEAEGG